ncbi:glutaredoxin 3 [Thalassomonas sp. M1454]|uniref:glutaredoxin 3 n=1 Tax=Thalassomonas sp. M1454 TaxID=2594477 RepID=UPI00117EEA13|nr:glutaredoxin 3 [Thalassomonas sp. M1454]TRX57922.1 glutaredoxin 3 [Thalassomonas sp. M1454]
MANVTIYTRDYCPYCIRAKALLDQKQVSYTEISIDKQPEKRVEMIERSKGGMTVPQIFINDQVIGGCDDLMALEYKQELDTLLAE